LIRAPVREIPTPPVPRLPEVGKSDTEAAKPLAEAPRSERSDPPMVQVQPAPAAAKPEAGPVKPVALPPVPPPPPEPVLSVKAVLKLENGALALAEVTRGGRPDGEPRLLRVGDEILGGRVVEIRDGSVVWEKDGARSELGLEPPRAAGK
jgi:hypothetical protein